MLDRLRVAFPYIVALLLPLAGVVLAVVRFADGQREEAIRMAALALLGLALLGLLIG